MSLHAPTLSRREREVFTLRASGLRDKEIAEEMGITTGTVKVHACRAAARLGVDTRAVVGQMAREAFEDRIRNYGRELLEAASTPATVRAIAGRMAAEVLFRKEAN